jgi:hypothetical protein
MAEECRTSYADMINSDEVFMEAITEDPGLADALNVGSCKTSREEKDTLGCKNGQMVFGQCIGMGGSKDKSILETTEGCESVAIQHTLNAGVSKALSCTSNSLSKKSKTKSSTIQALRVVIKNLNTGGGDFSFNSSQKAETDAQVIDFTSMEVQKEFKNTVEQELETLQESMQETKSDGFATGNSNKSLQQQITSSIASSADMNLTEVIQEAITSVCTKQGQDIVFEDIKTYGGDVSVELLQEAATKVVIDSVTKAVVGHISENSSIQKNIATAKAVQKNIRAERAMYTGIGTVMLFLLLCVMGCIAVFSIHRLGHQYMLPSYRLMCFWIAFFFTLLMVAIPVFREFTGFWILSVVILLLGITFSFFEIGKTSEKFSLGNGFQFLFAAYPEAGNVCMDPTNKKYCKLVVNIKEQDANILLDAAFNPAIQQSQSQFQRSNSKQQVQTIQKKSKSTK